MACFVVTETASINNCVPDEKENVESIGCFLHAELKDSALACGYLATTDLVQLPPQVWTVGVEPNRTMQPSLDPSPDPGYARTRHRLQCS